MQISYARQDLLNLTDFSSRILFSRISVMETSKAASLVPRLRARFFSLFSGTRELECALFLTRFLTQSIVRARACARGNSLTGKAPRPQQHLAIPLSDTSPTPSHPDVGLA